MQQLQFPTESFILETVMILFLIAALGSIVGVWFMNMRWKARLHEAWMEHLSVELDGQWYYVVHALEMHDFQIAKERCKRYDNKRSVIHEMTGG